MYIPSPLPMGIGKTYYSSNRSHGLDYERMIAKFHFPITRQTEFPLRRISTYACANSGFFPLNAKANVMSGTIKSSRLRIESGSLATISDSVQRFLTEDAYGCDCHAPTFKFSHRYVWNFEKALISISKDERLLASVVFEDNDCCLVFIGRVIGIREDGAHEFVEELSEQNPQFLVVEYVLCNANAFLAKSLTTTRVSCWWIDTEESPYLFSGFDNPRHAVEQADESVRGHLRSRLAKSVAECVLRLNDYSSRKGFDRYWVSDLIPTLSDESECAALFEFCDNHDLSFSDSLSLKEKFQEVIRIHRCYISIADHPVLDRTHLSPDNDFVYARDVDDSVITERVSPLLWQMRLGDGVILDSLNAFRYAKSRAYLADRIPEDLMQAITEAQSGARYLAFYAFREGDGFSKIDLRSQMSGECDYDKDSSGRMTELFVSDRISNRRFFVSYCAVMRYEGKPVFITHDWSDANTLILYVSNVVDQSLKRITLKGEDFQRRMIPSAGGHNITVEISDSFFLPLELLLSEAYAPESEE